LAVTLIIFARYIFRSQECVLIMYIGYSYPVVVYESIR